MSADQREPVSDAQDMGERVDEMRGRPSRLEPGGLKDALDFCEATELRLEGKKVTLYDAFDAFDREAARRQRWHFCVAAIAATCGFLVIVFALLQLLLTAAEFILHRLPTSAIELIPKYPRPWWLDFETLTARSELLEILMLGLALLAVAIGLWTALHKRWLIVRHKAERIRGLKFRFLSDPRLWAGLPDEKRQLMEWFDDQVRSIESPLDAKDLKRWMLTEDKIRVRPMPQNPRFSERDLEDLRSYYRKARYWSQLSYFATKSREHRLIHRLPQVLFFAAAGLVMLRVLLSLGTSSSEVEGVGIALLCFAVALPALGASIRTFNLSKEYERNALRSEAKKAALELIGERLRDPAGHEDLFLSLWACEYVLESDHREWLRLMIEAEWFG